MLITSWTWSPKSCPATKMQSTGLCQPHTVLRRQCLGLQHSFWCCRRCASQCRCSSRRWSHRRATKQLSIDCCSGIGRAVKHGKAGLPRMAITWAGTVHNVSNWSLRQVDGPLPDHLSDQLGNQQDWNRRVWPVWVLAGLCAMLGGPALLCHQQKIWLFEVIPQCLSWKLPCRAKHFCWNYTTGLLPSAVTECSSSAFPLSVIWKAASLVSYWGVQPIFMGASTVNQLERITEIMSTLTQADLDANHFPFHFFFCLFAP